MTFIEFLEQRVRAADSLLCVGLDPRAEGVAELREQCADLIDATAPFAAAFKPNSAFFEAHGPDGLLALQDVIAYVPDDIPVILDGKRGDIGDTSEAYAAAAFDQFSAHALTVNPYLGGEAVAPFIARPEFGAFMLCKTSNPGADEFQNLTDEASGAKFYELIAQRAQAWNTRNNVGLVVGASDPEALARVRTLAPDLWFLVPGIGAQGGDLEKTLAAGLRRDGLGLIINASRSIARAPNPGEEARRLRDEINRRRTRRVEIGDASGTRRVLSPTPLRSASGAGVSNLAQDLLTSQCVQFGQFTLKSSKVSPIYLDLRRLVTYPAILKRVAQAYAALLRDMPFDRIAGLPYAALPIGTAVALEMGRPLIYPRREVKDYGTKAAIEGEYQAGETVVVLDDLTTTGGTKIEAIRKLEAAGLKARDIVVLIDREQGARETLAAAGYTLHAVTTLRELLGVWRASGAITLSQYQEVLDFLTRFA